MTKTHADAEFESAHVEGSSLAMEEDDAASPRAKEEDEAAPWPAKQLAVLGCCCCTSTCVITVIFPYVAFLVDSMDVASSRKEVGYYVGILGSAFMWTRTLSQIPSGLLADRFGRKVVIVVSLFVMAIGSVGFGLAPSFWIAVALRSFCGFFHCVLPPAKAMAT